MAPPTSTAIAATFGMFTCPQLELQVSRRQSNQSMGHVTQRDMSELKLTTLCSTVRRSRSADSTSMLFVHDIHV